MDSTTPSPAICAIFVTFHPDESLLERFNALPAWLDHLVVVDNEATQTSRQLLASYQSESTQFSVIHNEHNLGIATALNQGMSLAIQKRVQVVATFDQDSIISVDYLSTMIRTYNEHGDNIYGCNYWNAHKNRCLVTPDPPEQCQVIKKPTLITSGMLFSTDLYQKIGPFRDDYFIDSVDHEFCLRARSKGYQTLLCTAELMKHQIGSSGTSDKLSQRLVYSHPPIRMYYKARNTVTTIKQYCFREPVWCLKYVLGMFADLAGILMNKGERTNKLRHFLRGLSHGLRGKSGNHARLMNS